MAIVSLECSSQPGLSEAHHKGTKDKKKKTKTAEPSSSLRRN
jgi:hypothetical protein